MRPPASLNQVKTLTVAVIDTGFGYRGLGDKTHLCKFGHKNFSKNPEVVNGIPVDTHGHGTNIAGVIDRYALGTTRPYCLVIVKYYDPAFMPDNNLKNEIDAIQYAINIKADVINFSGGGLDANPQENEVVKKYIDKGGVFIAAAGNERSDLEKRAYYPAMSDSRVISVGNIDKEGYIMDSSNYGKPVSCYEVGEKVAANGLIFTGTSQATATATGKFIAGKPCGTK